MDKQSIGWGIRSMRYKAKTQTQKEENLLRKCWEEKDKYERNDTYETEREKFYNRAGWSLQAIKMLKNEGRDRKRNTQQRKGSSEAVERNQN